MLELLREGWDILFRRHLSLTVIGIIFFVCLLVGAVDGLLAADAPGLRDPPRRADRLLLGEGERAQPRGDDGAAAGPPAGGPGLLGADHGQEPQLVHQALARGRGPVRHAGPRRAARSSPSGRASRAPGGRRRCAGAAACSASGRCRSRPATRSASSSTRTRTAGRRTSSSTRRRPSCRTSTCRRRTCRARAASASAPTT